MNERVLAFIFIGLIILAFCIQRSDRRINLLDDRITNIEAAK